MLKALPVDWDYTVTYGIIYSHNPNTTIQRFIE